LDACVAFDLQDAESSKTRESKAILADWLADEFELCVTEELSHEINRNPDPKERNRRWEFSSAFECLHHSRSQFAKVKTDLADLFPEPRSDSDESDLNQVSMAIAGEAQFFVTRDDPLLEKKANITSRWGLVLLRPSELVGQSYEQRREGLYRPERLAGSSITEARARVEDIPVLTEAFLSHGSGETKNHFKQILRHASSGPHDNEIRLFRDRYGDAAGLLVTDNTTAGLSQIRLIRVARVRGSDLVARHLLWQAVVRAAEVGRNAVVVRDSHYPRALEPAYKPLGFYRERSCWLKLVMGGLWSPKALASALRALSFPDEEADFPSRVAAVAENSPQSRSPQSYLDLELAIWPGKIEASPLPTYLVPIRAHWASQLFEERIAGYDLFGAPPGLILNTENVYYRAARGPRLEAPARVLWYVSDAAGVPHSKQVAGCSYIREVAVGPATQVFGTFQRLGIYAWKDVLAVAKGAPRGQVMAFRFSHTELFRFPVPYKVLKSEVELCSGAKLTVRGPRQLSATCFDVIYRRGMRAA
jgi:predicted nucleic acid-binding protein